ncbi:MAG: hypothetical protein PHV02_17010 [Rhodocyclaceae bacterium]|nr:hypothetical protein [Rhodocyclaceae bacterium]
MNHIDMQSVRKIAMVILVAIIVAASWLAPLDDAGTERVDASFKRALISYGSARALNAVISFAQGTEMSFQPLGIGLNLAPGQILDPLNDLVEQLSQLMLIATVALGIEKILLSIGASWAISLAVTAIAVAWGTLFIFKKPQPTWLSKLLFLSLMLRFVIPVSLVGTGILYQNFMASDYHASQSIVEATAINLDKAPEVTEGNASSTDTVEKQPSLLNRWFGKQVSEPHPDGTKQGSVHFPSTSSVEQNSAAQNDGGKSGYFENLNPKHKFERFKESAEKAVEHIIQLMVIFLLDTIILPIFLIWALVRIGRASFLISIKRQTTG